MSKKSRESSSRRQNSRTTSKKTLPEPEFAPKPTLRSKTEQLIAVSQARRRQLRANISALTHLLFKNFHLTGGAYQLRLPRKSQTQARRSSPNHQLFGEVGVSIVNEISQPLNAILSNLGAASHLLGAESSELSEIFRDVRTDALRACGIVNDMRELFEGKVTRKTLLQVNATVESLVKTLSVEARQQHTSLMADLVADLPEVYADAAQIEHAIANLVWNGMEAMEDINPRERALVIATRYQENIVEISISDRGAGISPAAFPHLFETYFTTKPDRMGLGLAVARSIAELHQGTITAQNNPGRGATFRMWLPIGRGQELAERVTGAVASS